jgi:hypothetical protein
MAMRSRPQRAAGLAQARARGVRRPTRAGSGRPDERDIAAESARWDALAPTVGFCCGCGAIVDEPAGRLHDEGCIESAPERCRKGQRS